MTAPLYHWRRHDESAYGLLGDHADTNICATACGRLVAYQEAAGEPWKATCPECEDVRLGVSTVQYIRKLGVEAGALAAINEIFGPVISENT